jgi:hypothetical protein
MIWSIDTDDFLPECSNVKYPLLRAINSAFKAAYIDKQGDKKRTSIRQFQYRIWHFDRLLIYHYKIRKGQNEN